MDDITFYFEAHGISRKDCHVLEMYKLKTGRKFVRGETEVVEEVLEGQVDDFIKNGKGTKEPYEAWKASIAEKEGELIAAAKNKIFGPKVEE